MQFYYGVVAGAIVFRIIRDKVTDLHERETADKEMLKIIDEAINLFGKHDLNIRESRAITLRWEKPLEYPGLLAFLGRLGAQYQDFADEDFAEEKKIYDLAEAIEEPFPNGFTQVDNAIDLCATLSIGAKSLPYEGNIEGEVCWKTYHRAIERSDRFSITM